MAQESIVGLVRDLTTRLSAIAVEFGARADQLTSPDGRESGVVNTGDLTALANHLLAERVARFEHFPTELFHEPAWDMLLALFVASEEQRIMNVKTLVACANAPVTTSQRWIDHLHKLKLIDRVIDPVDRRRMDISLSDIGHRAVADYLSRIAAGGRAPV